jgi:hypothetical protein
VPVTFTFDIEDNSVKDANDRTRIQMAFLRLGWEHIGGSAWRYPALNASPHPSEDWMNHVVPALMYFRSLVEHSGMRVTKFTIDAHSEAGYRSGGATPVGQAILPGANIPMYTTGIQQSQDDKLSEARLRKYLTEAAESLK